MRSERKRVTSSFPLSRAPWRLLRLPRLFGFLLALLDDFGLGRCCSGYGDRLGGLLFLDAQGHDVRQHASRIGKQLDLFRINRQIAGAKLDASSVRDVHLEFGGNVRGQAFDFDFAGDDFKDAALQLDALGSPNVWIGTLTRMRTSMAMRNRST